MNHPDHRKTIIPENYFEKNLDFAKQVLNEYEDEKSKNCSWYGPKTPFVITKPKLTNNAFCARRVLNKNK